MNIWEYVGAKNVAITDVDGHVFTGSVIACFDAEETCDGKDSIDIQTQDGLIIGFTPDEIAKIERL